jgi:hypothetical protein
MLHQPDSIHRMHLLELVLAQEIQDGASGIALRGLRPDSLDVNIAGQRGRAQQILLAGEQEIGLVGAATHLVGIRLRGLRLCFCIHISDGQHPLHLVLRAEKEGGLVRLQGSALALHAGMVQHDFMRLAGDVRHE